MDASEFWCRAFLAEMNTSRAGLDSCEKNADAALAVAQRRGMVATGQAGALDTLRRTAIRWVNAAMANDVDEYEAASDDLMKAAEALGPAPTLERVEFTAERVDPGLWVLHGEAFGIVNCDERRDAMALNDGTTIRITWGETAAPNPIEVWIERPSGG
jgi:hypothetical protein